MIKTTTRCNICCETFEAVGDSIKSTEKQVIDEYMEHINSSSHKVRQKMMENKKYVTYVSKTKCRCGETVQVESGEVQRGEIDDEFRRWMDRRLFNELNNHMESPLCKMRINRNNKIDKLI